MIAILRYGLVAATLATLTACGGEPEAPQAPPPPEVGVIAAQPQSVPLQRDLVGRLLPYRSADVRARVPGVLLERVYVEGRDVKEGDVLFRIDPAPLQAALGAAQAQLAQAQASFTNAKVAADRGRELAPKNYISKADLDNLEAAERSGAAAVQAARASVTSARINLDYATVRAPISGRAGQQQVTEGALVGQGAVTLLTTIDQLDPLYVGFSMSATEMEQLRQSSNSGDVDLEGGDASVRIVLADGRLYPLAGSLDYADAAVDPATGAISLRARIDNPDLALMPGMFVNVRAQMGQRANAYLVPQTAVLRDAHGPYALVVGTDGKVIRRDLVIDGSVDRQSLVTAGLEPGDQVVVSGVQKVQVGASAVAQPVSNNDAPTGTTPPEAANDADAAEPDAAAQPAQN